MTRNLLRKSMLCAVVAFAALPALAQKGGNTGGEFELNPAGPLDFGDVDASGPSADLYVKLENNSSDVVDVDLPSTLGAFTITLGAGSYSISPGQFVQLAIRYAPKHMGMDFVETYVAPQEDLLLSLRGRAITLQDCGMLTPESDFGEVTLGSPEAVAVLVSNNTSTIVDFNYAGGCNAFRLLSATPITVPPGQTGQFLVEFDPLYEGSYVAQVSTDCGSSSWLRGNAVAAAPKMGGDGMMPVSTGISMRVGPNPMRTEASIRYVNASRSTIAAELRIVDVRGRVLFEQPMEVPSGGHVWRWDGRNRDGESVAAGVYFIELATPGSTVRQKVSVIR